MPAVLNAQEVPPLVIGIADAPRPHRGIRLRRGVRFEDMGHDWYRRLRSETTRMTREPGVEGFLAGRCPGPLPIAVLDQTGQVRSVPDVARLARRAGPNLGSRRLTVSRFLDRSIFQPAARVRDPLRVVSALQ